LATAALQSIDRSKEDIHDLSSSYLANTVVPVAHHHGSSQNNVTSTYLFTDHFQF